MYTLLHVRAYISQLESVLVGSLNDTLVSSRCQCTSWYLLALLGWSGSTHWCVCIAGRFDVPVPPLQPPKQSAHVASMLYIADFLTQFTKVLAIKPISFLELSACLHPNTPSNTLLDPPATTASRDPAGAAGRPTAVGSDATAPVANGVAGLMSNGTIAKGPAQNGAGKGADGMTAAGSEALFELYRGLLQFLLQVLPPISTLHITSDCCPCMSKSADVQIKTN